MKLKNITASIRQVLIRGQVVYVYPGEIIEGEKIQFDSGAFEEQLEEIDSNLVGKKKLNSRKNKK